MRWWVGFSGVRPNGWWDAFTAPGFRHCFAFCEIAPNSQLLIEPTQELCYAQVSVGPTEKMVERVLERPGVTLLCWINPHRYDLLSTGYRLRDRSPLLTCASAVAYHIGLRGWVATPQGLHRRLIAEGAHHVEGRERDAS